MCQRNLGQVNPLAPQRVRIYPKFRLPTGYEFSITPIRTGARTLYCDIAAGTDPAVKDYDYRFCTTAIPSAEESMPCVSDLNGDGAVNTADLTIFLGQFGDSDWCVGDLNQDGVVNTADLVLFLGAFGGTCPVLEEEEELRMPAGGEGPDQPVSSERSRQPAPNAAWNMSVEAPVPLPPVLAAMGFTSEVQYLEFVESLDQQGLAAHIADLLATIKALGLE